MGAAASSPATALIETPSFEPPSEKVMSEREWELFIEETDFGGMRFIDALHFFSSQGKLPGEGQIIRVLVTTFASKFVHDNEFPNLDDVDFTVDAAHILALSLLMLNTDAHTPIIREKMTREQYIRNLRGCFSASGEDFPDRILEEAYTFVTSIPLGSPSRPVVFPQPIKMTKFAAKES